VDNYKTRTFDDLTALYNTEQNKLYMQHVQLMLLSQLKSLDGWNGFKMAYISSRVKSLNDIFLKKKKKSF